MFNKYAVLIAVVFMFCMQAVCAGERLWDREPSLWDAAQGVTLSRVISSGNPQPAEFWSPGEADDNAASLCTRTLLASLWGPPEHMTVSIKKTDVWDRRGYYEDPLPLSEIEKKLMAGEDAPEHYRSWYAYDFPCPKPVGQIIVTCPDVEGAGQPTAVTSCSDGTTSVRISKDKSELSFKYLPMMTRNIVAVHVEGRGLVSPLSVRLYRHRDINGRTTSTMGTIDSEGAHKNTEEARPGRYKGYDYTKDVDPDIGPLDPPEAGTDGRIFWIRQRIPAEKTFPNGFEYVMAGLITGSDSSIDTINGEKDLGTPPYLPANQQEIINKRGFFWLLYPKYIAIREAPGSAATAQLPAMQNVKFDCLVAIVTSSDSSDPLAEAKRRLERAEKEGFGTLAAENAEWFKSLYGRREKGRIFFGREDNAKSQVPGVFRSWTNAHTGRVDPDPVRYEAASSYAFLEQDWDPWHGLPCYNEIYNTGDHVQSRSDRMDYYVKLCNLWLPACKSNADQVFGLPGGLLQHGYLPPIKPDKYAHCTSIWEFCMEIPAQVMKTVWDYYDYGGDEKVLSESVYPALRETAIFYSHYAKLGDDGYYHVIPTVSAEHWGLTKYLEKNKDSTSALCMFKWLLNTAADASEILGVDADLRDRWREVASKMAPYPTWDTPEGPVYTDVRGVNPIGVDYNFFAGVTPCLLADEVNLDSTPEEREMMLRTARLVKGWMVRRVPPLLGAEKGYSAEQLINSRSGRIHLFPAVPEGATVAFKDMQARGGFEVSAEIINGSVTYVLIKSRRDLECKLMNPWPGAMVKISDCTGKTVPYKVDTANGECLIFQCEKMASYEVKLLR